MKKFYTLLSVALTFSAFGQTSPGDHGSGCVSAQDNEVALPENHPLKIELKELEERFSTEGISLNESKGICDPTIPVVFHIVDQNPNKVTDAQIASAMTILNDDFNKMNAEIGSLHPSFDPIAADVDVQFKLAQKDPNGNSTSGIVRVVADGLCYSTSGGGDIAWNCPVKLTSPAWNTNNYLNIWIVNDPFGGTSNATTGSGWAFRAESVPNLTSGEDGIVYNHRYLGLTGSSDVSDFLGDMSRVLTHEVGHYLNLRHTFTGYCGSGNDDEVSDTPKVAYNNCGTSSGTGCCPWAGADMVYWSSCDGVTPVNYENYMDYSECPGMFTNGQNVKMQAALASSVRSNLISDANQIATGVCVENTSSVEEHNLLDLLVYPNTFTDQITIELSSSSVTHISIVNLLGAVVYERDIQAFEAQKLTIDLGHVGSGIYLLNAQSIDGSGQVKLQKL